MIQNIIISIVKILYNENLFNKGNILICLPSLRAAFENEYNSTKTTNKMHKHNYRCILKPVGSLNVTFRRLTEKKA